MTRRAYSPRSTTVDLIAAILDRTGVARVQTIAPRHASSSTLPTMLRVTLDTPDGNGRPIYTDFTLPDARSWLAAEIADEPPAFAHFYRPAARTGDALATCLDCGQSPAAPGFGARHEARR